MGKKKLPYKEGNWFGVPLISGGYALGLVTRLNGENIVLGYFFGPRREDFPNKEYLDTLKPKDAVLIGQFDDLGLINGTWKIICETNLWKREDWPVPGFSRVDVINGQLWRIDYSGDNLKFLRKQMINLEEALTLPKDGLYGYIAVEKVLTKLLSDNNL